jgi:hypothetical protein
MSVLVWIANHALWISLAGALCAIIVRFEKSLPKRLHRILLACSLFVGLATPLLGLLKKSMDDQWKIELQRQVSAATEATRQKPFKVRLIAFLDSVDKRIVPALAAGQTVFPGQLGDSQFTDLKRLAGEPGAQEYVTVNLSQIGFSFGQGGGTVNSVEITLNPSLLKP